MHRSFLRFSIFLTKLKKHHFHEVDVRRESSIDDSEMSEVEIAAAEAEVTFF